MDTHAQICSTCAKPKAPLQCGLCHCSLCKYCAQFVEEEEFSFLAQLPPELAHSVYCGPCFNEKVSPKKEDYQELLGRAKDILVYDKTQGKETRLVKRLEDPVYIEDCADYEETLLRLAFFAAQANYNAIVDVNITSKKIRDGSYLTTKWSGSAIPAQVRPEKMIKNRTN